MAEKFSSWVSSTARSRNSKRSADGVVRVTHISNPTTMVRASASEFPGVVQNLTGRKRSSPSSSHREEINLCSDNEYSPQGRAPKLVKDELQCLNDVKSSESAVTHDMAAVGVCCKDRDHDSVFEELGVLPVISDGCIMSHQLFETAASREDTCGIFSDIFSPSTQFSEFEHLRKP